MLNVPSIMTTQNSVNLSIHQSCQFIVKFHCLSLVSSPSPPIFDDSLFCLPATHVCPLQPTHPVQPQLQPLAIINPHNTEVFRVTSSAPFSCKITSSICQPTKPQPTKENAIISTRIMSSPSNKQIHEKKCPTTTTTTKNKSNNENRW